MRGTPTRLANAHGIPGTGRIDRCAGATGTTGAGQIRETLTDAVARALADTAVRVRIAGDLVECVLIAAVGVVAAVSDVIRDADAATTTALVRAASDRNTGVSLACFIAATAPGPAFCSGLTAAIAIDARQFTRAGGGAIPAMSIVSLGIDAERPAEDLILRTACLALAVDARATVSTALTAAAAVERIRLGIDARRAALDRACLALFLFLLGADQFGPGQGTAEADQREQTTNVASVHGAVDLKHQIVESSCIHVPLQCLMLQTHFPVTALQVPLQQALL